MIRYRKGDLIDALNLGMVDVIAHQANCFNTMGSGVAKAIRENFPEAYEADCRTVKGDKGKLGSVSIASVPAGFIFNLYGQYNYGKDGSQYTDYLALADALGEMARVLNACDFTGDIGLPKIGAGTGGGDWSIIETLIDLHLDQWNVYIFEL